MARMNSRVSGYFSVVFIFMNHFSFSQCIETFGSIGSLESHRRHSISSDILLSEIPTRSEGNHVHTGGSVNGFVENIHVRHAMHRHGGIIQQATDSSHHLSDDKFTNFDTETSRGEDNVPRVQESTYEKGGHDYDSIIRKEDEFGNSSNSIVIPHTTATETHKCLALGCMQNQQLEATLPGDTLRAMRLELIKQQILRKLRLKEPPNTADLSRELLPLPLAQGNILPKRRQYMKNRDRDVEDFYGKTEQVIVFPEDAMPRCVTRRADPSACFLFNLPKEVHAEEVNSAELWVFKLHDAKDGRNQTFWVSEVSQREINHSSTKSKFIDIKQDIMIREGWMSFNISRAMKRWLDMGSYDHSVQIGCKTCLMNASESPINTFREQRPFIVINISGIVQKKRSRRNINCSPGLSECCRESFVVSFREIGWDSWIIAPAEYDAFYCKGSCVSINGISHSAARRTTIIQKYIQTHGLNNRTAEITPCCTATKMSPISLAYRDPNNLNTTIKLEHLPNMVIESCGCL